MMNIERLKQLNLRLITKLAEPDEPSFCTEEYEEHCHYCAYIKEEMVSHPAGNQVHSVEKYSCDLGHWEDDF